jgi:hypothetical protein
VAILALTLICAVCGFYVYVLVQFRRDEKHPRRACEESSGVPIAASGQIVVMKLSESKALKHGTPGAKKFGGNCRHSRNVVRVWCSSLCAGLDPVFRAKRRAGSGNNGTGDGRNRAGRQIPMKS